MIGQTIAHYKVTEKLGAGGMGEVYRATDTKLNRDVALKVLPEEFARDADRMARFKREAQVLASLNHPNIAAIYGLEQEGDTQAIALELVEGPTLSERIQQGALPLEEALNIARQIAEALEAAHEKGIIHRDLKPANVKVTPEGTVKVLDFGLAKALEDDPSSIDISKSPTLSVAATQAGVILGTAAYMSPEQARGQAVDKRADIWAFGVVLYEMLTGKQTFTGETISDVLAHVLTKEPEWDALPADVPPPIRKLLQRCLTRERKQRLQAIGDARITLEETLSGATEEVVFAGPPGATAPERRPWFHLAAVVVLTAVIAGVTAWNLNPTAPELPLRKLEIVVGGPETGPTISPEISPDGTMIAYGREEKLWIRHLDQLSPREITTVENPRLIVWSPDSRWVAYLSAGQLWKILSAGGTPVPLAKVPGIVDPLTSGAVWKPDGKILFSTLSPIYEVSEQGGDPQLVHKPDPEIAIAFTQVNILPGGRGLLVGVFSAQGGEYDSIGVISEAGQRILMRVGNGMLFNPLYSPTGHILYSRSDPSPGLWAVPFSLDSLELTGESFLVVPGAGKLSLAAEGTLAYSPEGFFRRSDLVWLNRKGEVEERIAELPSAWWPMVSPDGNRIAISTDDTGTQEVWVYDLRSNTRQQITSQPTNVWRPNWSPDGSRLVFEVMKGGGSSIFVKSADGSAEAREVVPGGFSAHFSRDGKYLLFGTAVKSGPGDLGYLKLGEDFAPAGDPTRLTETPWGEEEPKLSPDGSYLAFGSDESGRKEIYLMRFPDGSGKVQVTSKGAQFPRWNAAGDELFYVGTQGKNLVALPIQTQPELRLGKPKVIYSWNHSHEFTYDVTPNGRRFVIYLPRRIDSGHAHTIKVIQNWFAEFKDKD